MAQPTRASAPPHPIPGVDYPVDVAQLRAWFPDDSACLDYLDWLRWPEGFQCPRCGSRDASRDDRPGRYRCRKCWHRSSVTQGTILEKTRIPLTVWFETIWLVTAGKTGVSAAYLQRILPISSYQTAWTMLARLRHVMGSGQSDPLRGRVEVDESFFGGYRPGVRGRGALGKSLVAGAIEITEHGWGRARLIVVPDASTESLRAFITANIAPGSTIVTDGLASYPGAVQGYSHEPVNVTASGRPAHEVLPAVHRLFALVKRMIEGTYQGSGTVGHLQEYLDEFVFRFNRRASSHRGLVFLRLLQRAVSTDPVRYRELVRDSRSKSVHPTGVSGPRSRPGSLTPRVVFRPWRSRE